MADARTARDEAIAAIVRAFDEHRGELDIYDAMRETLEAAGYEPFFEYALDAIPNDVLARYAIECGCFDESGKEEVARTEALPGGRVRNHFRPLYRLATEDE